MANFDGSWNVSARGVLKEVLPSMSEAEIQPLVSIVLRCPQVLVPLVLRHLLPDCIAGLVLADIVPLDEANHDHVQGYDAKEDFVSSAVKRSVVFAVNLSYGQRLRTLITWVWQWKAYVGCNDRARLADHVVHCAAQCSGAY